MHTLPIGSYVAKVQNMTQDAELCPVVQGGQGQLASAKEALKAADSAAQVQQLKLQGLVEELQACKAHLQQQVQSLQVMFPDLHE